MEGRDRPNQTGSPATNKLGQSIFIFISTMKMEVCLLPSLVRCMVDGLAEISGSRDPLLIGKFKNKK